jgi:hypothetical protein
MTFVRPASSIRPEQPLMWVRVISVGSVAAMMTCPEGHLIDLHDLQIDQSGRVSPPVDCPQCDFRDEVTLVSWRAAA